MARPLRPLKWYRTLAAEKGRLGAMAFLVEGERAIGQIAGIRPGEIIEIVSSGELPEPGELPKPLFEFPNRQVAESQFGRISNTVTPQGIMAVVRLPRDAYSDALPASVGARVLLLEDVQDPGNVGALIRTAAAFAYSGVILSERCADPFSPKSVQATAGAVLSVWLRRTGRYMELVKKLKADGYSIVTADVNGEEGPHVLHESDRLLLALGSETAGPSAALLGISEHRFRIPIARKKAESLNVAAGGAISMYLSSMNSAMVARKTAAGKQRTRPDS
jgi:TrmH family RNA methyltransferase